MAIMNVRITEMSNVKHAPDPFAKAAETFESNWIARPNFLTLIIITVTKNKKKFIRQLKNGALMFLPCTEIQLSGCMDGNRCTRTKTRHCGNVKLTKMIRIRYGNKMKFMTSNSSHLHVPLINYQLPPRAWWHTMIIIIKSECLKETKWNCSVSIL